MPVISPADLALLRTHPHKVKEYLAVLQPATVLACRLNGAPSGDPVVQISYDTVTEGSYTDVVAGMTLWIGTVARGKDKGMCRVRKAPTSSILYIGEDSIIDWADNDYLTVVEDYQLWVKYPRVQTGGGLTIHKDWDIDYTDQHKYWQPVAILGGPEAQFIDPYTGVATCRFVGDRSYAVAPGATITGYSWSFPGGTPSSSTDPGTEASPVEVTWDTPGDNCVYWVTLKVTDSNGKTHTGRRPVFIFNEVGETGLPITRFQMTGRSGSLDRHGHSASFEVYGDADQEQFPDRALVVYWTEDWYGNTKKSIGGNYPYRAHIKFVGYIQEESTTKDPETSTVTFKAATIDSLMATREGFSCWLKTNNNPTNWTQAKNLTADRAALTLCRYQSTLLDICDVIPTGNALYIKSQEFAAKTTLLQQLQTLYDDLFAHVACDKQSRVYFDLDPQMKTLAARGSIPIVMDLEHGDWQGELQLPRPQEPKTSIVNLAGVYFPGGSAAVVPLLSVAPGNAPGYTGGPREISGLILAGQNDANVKSGLALAYDNNEFPNVSIPLSGLYEVFDIVPQEYVRLSLVVTDTKRGIVWTNQKLIPRQVDLSMDETETGRVPAVKLEVEKDSYGPPGINGDYPNDVPEPEIALPPPPPNPSGGDTRSLACIGAATGGPVLGIGKFWWSQTTGATWEERSTGLPSAEMLDCILDPFWFVKKGTYNPEEAIVWACGAGFVSRSPNAGLTWETKTPTTDPPNYWGFPTPPTAQTVRYVQVLGDPLHQDVFYILAYIMFRENEINYDGGWLAKTGDNGETWTWKALTLPPCDLEYGALALWADLDHEDGSRLYVAQWEKYWIEEEDLHNEVHICRYDTETLAGDIGANLCSCSEEDITYGTVVRVRCQPPGTAGVNGDHVWAFGWWDDSARLVLSTDGGETVVSRASEYWDFYDKVGSLAILEDGETLYAFTTGYVPKTPDLWYSPNYGLTWQLLNGSMPFDVGADGMSRCTWSANEFVIGNADPWNFPGSQAQWGTSPYAPEDWTDATGDPGLPTDRVVGIFWVG